MLWVLLIVGNVICTYFLSRLVLQMRDDIAELEMREIANSIRGSHVDIWEDVRPVDENLPDMSEEVILDDLT